MTDCVVIEVVAMVDLSWQSKISVASQHTSALPGCVPLYSQGPQYSEQHWGDFMDAILVLAALGSTQ